MTRVHARASELLRYDQATGELHWRFARSGIGAGPAGSNSANGYVYISIDGQRYLAHRLAWLIAHGEWPAGQIDHINGNRADNRLVNLRVVTNAQNQQNRKRAQANNASCGLLGVSRMNNKWRARIVKDGALRYLGVFETAEEAHAVYMTAKRELHVFAS